MVLLKYSYEIKEHELFLSVLIYLTQFTLLKIIFNDMKKKLKKLHARASMFLLKYTNTFVQSSYRRNLCPSYDLLFICKIYLIRHSKNSSIITHKSYKINLLCEGNFNFFDIFNKTYIYKSLHL